LVSAAISLTPKNGAVAFGLRYVTKGTPSDQGKGNDSTAKSANNNSFRQSTNDLRTRRTSLLLEKPEEIGKGVPRNSRRSVFGTIRISTKTAVDREDNVREQSSEKLSSGKGPCFVVLEITHSGIGFDKADARKMNEETFSFNPNGKQYQVIPADC
jgi:hypothetical protein